MYIITQKQDDFVVGLCHNLIDNNDGSFTDADEGCLYYKGEYCYYPNVDTPAGVRVNQYTYTPEEGFKLAFSQLDLMRMKLSVAYKEDKATEALEEIKSLYSKNDIPTIQEAICNLYELFLFNSKANNIDGIVKIYADLVTKNKKSIDEVPETIRQIVLKEVNKINE